MKRGTERNVRGEMRIDDMISGIQRCVVALACGAVLAQPSILRGDAISECVRIFEAEIRDGVVHGAAVVAGGIDGKPLTGAWGWADAAHTVPMTTRTVVDIASVTKVAAGMTAYLVEHAKGRVDFDAPFTNYLASYTAPLARNVTIRDLAKQLDELLHDRLFFEGKLLRTSPDDPDYMKPFRLTVFLRQMLRLLTQLIFRLLFRK